MTNKTTTSKKKSFKGNKTTNSQPKVSFTVKPKNIPLNEWQIALRTQIAESEHFGVSELNHDTPTGEYCVTNPITQQSYKVVYRGEKNEWNYCSCMDFKTSQLGTCKHLKYVKRWIADNRKSVCKLLPPYTSVYLSYSGKRVVKIRIGESHQKEFQQLASKYFTTSGELRKYGFDHFDEFLQLAKSTDETFRCYDDVLDFVIEQRERKERTDLIDKKYDDSALDAVLSTRLFPYQKEGVRFACKNGRTIIADEMGLGKTIQAICTAEILRRENFIDNILIVCPTSLKYQWKREIERFAHVEALVIEGNPLVRQELYSSAFQYKIVSYNTMCNDVRQLGSLQADMLIMDEVQRLKNWKTQIAHAARKIESHYSVILSGTPLENKLEELYSIIQLVDQYVLGPYYLFKDRHILCDENGKIIGYKNLNDIRKQLCNVLVRRQKSEVSLQLPHRMDKNLFVPMTKEQRIIHDDYKSLVARIIAKWQRYHFLSDRDRLQLLKLLSQMRMVCDSTYILDQKSRYDTKIDETMNILESIFSSGNEKVVIFSQWERMTRIVAQELSERGIRFEYLHGGVPSKARKELTKNFEECPDSRVFLSTDAGCTGLNLQAASTITNLELPWNPAILEQRIARIYRIGQQRNIQVINLISSNSFEEDMIGKLQFKSSMFEGALDNGADVVYLGKGKFQDLLETLDKIDFAEADTSKAKSETIDNNEQEEKSLDNIISTTETLSANDTEANPSENKKLSASQEVSGIPTQSVHQSPSSEAVSTPASPNELIAQGRTFLSGLLQTLQSPEATSKLIDSIVKEDENSGQTYLNIPVSNKQNVNLFLEMVGKLLGSGK